MSKYYKAEDVINLLATEYYTNALAEGFDVKESDFKEDAIANTKHLPIIEVSEDCISRSALISFIDAGHLRNPNEKCYSENDVVELIKNAPSVVPKERINNE